MNQNKFKIGTIFSFKDFADDTNETLALILSKQERRDGYIGLSYLLYFINGNDEFWVNQIQLSRQVENKHWKIEYEPE